mgnify:CR=1 FL=1
MKAAWITGHGGNEVVCFGERPQPDDLTLLVAEVTA